MNPVSSLDWKRLFKDAIEELVKADHPLELITRKKSEETLRDLMVGHMLTVEDGQIILSESRYGIISLTDDPNSRNLNMPDILHFGQEFTRKSIANPKMYVEIKAAYNGDFKLVSGRNAAIPWAELNVKDSLAFFSDSRRLVEFKEIHPETVCLQGLIVCYNAKSNYSSRNKSEHKVPTNFSDAFAKMIKDNGAYKSWLKSKTSKQRKQESTLKSKGKNTSKQAKELRYNLELLFKSSAKVVDAVDFSLTRPEDSEKYWVRLYLFEWEA